MHSQTQTLDAKMNTYQETILRFQVQAHDELPEAHKEAYRADGIDPDTIWNTIWSFSNLNDAELALRELSEEAPAWRTLRVVDAGESKTIERPIY